MRGDGGEGVTTACGLLRPMERGGQGAESAGLAQPASAEDHVISGIWAGLSKGLQPPPRCLPSTRALLANDRIRARSAAKRYARRMLTRLYLRQLADIRKPPPQLFSIRPWSQRNCFPTSTSSERGRWVTHALAPRPKTKMADPWNVAGVVLAGGKLLWQFGVFWNGATDAPEEARKCLNPPHADPLHPDPGRLTTVSSRRAEIHSRHTPTERQERAECLARG